MNTNIFGYPDRVSIAQWPVHVHVREEALRSISGPDWGISYYR